MEDTLRYLKENNHLLGIVTSKTKESYELNITPYGLDDYFDVIITSSDTEEHKPSGQPLTECLRRLGVAENEAIYIGGFHLRQPMRAQCRCCIRIGRMGIAYGRSIRC